MPLRAPAEPIADPAGWYRQHYALVRDAVIRWGVASAAVDDAVQETFVIAYRRRRQFDGGSMAAWLYAIARRVASNARRSAARRDRKSLVLAQELVAPSDRGPELGAAVVAVERFVATLSPLEREVFVLSEIDGLTGPEVARCLGHNLASTYTRIRRVRGRFAAHCQDSRGALARRRAARQQAPPAACVAFMQLLPATGTTAPVIAGAASWLTGALVSAGIATTVLATIAAIADGVAQPSATPAATIGTTAVTAAGMRSAPAVKPAATAADGADPPGRALGPPLTESTHPPVTAKPPSVQSRPPPELSTAVIALREGRARDAMRTLRRHRRAFPNSAVADVRDALRIETLCALGRSTEAQQSATRFEQTYPQSPLTNRVALACPK